MLTKFTYIWISNHVCSPQLTTREHESPWDKDGGGWGAEQTHASLASPSVRSEPRALRLLLTGGATEAREVAGQVLAKLGESLGAARERG